MSSFKSEGFWRDTAKRKHYLQFLVQVRRGGVCRCWGICVGVSHVSARTFDGASPNCGPTSSWPSVPLRPWAWWWHFTVFLPWKLESCTACLLCRPPVHADGQTLPTTCIPWNAWSSLASHSSTCKKSCVWTPSAYSCLHHTPRSDSFCKSFLHCCPYPDFHLKSTHASSCWTPAPQLAL